MSNIIILSILHTRIMCYRMRMKPVQWKDVQKAIKTSDRIYDTDMITLAYETALNAHDGQFRATGEPYIHHPLAVAKRLVEWHMDQEVVIAGILHDVPEDTEMTIEDIEKDFGKNIARLVGGITKLSTIKYRGMERYAENLRKMFIAMSTDIRVIVIKFADRLHNLKTLDGLRPDKRHRIALESLEIYAPIADRLGMGAIKTELEDISFKWVLPEAYADVIKKVEHLLPTLEDNLNAMTKAITKLMKTHDVPIVSIHGRRKGLYSLHKKLCRKHHDITQIYDIIALRLITDSEKHCYQALGIIHGTFTPLPGRIKDYIALPKINGYRSLHTTVFTNHRHHDEIIDGREALEIQIRTPEIHEQAEYGVAAHWHYKQTGSATASKETLEWVTDLVKWQEDISNEDLIERLKTDVFHDRIFVLTPHGDPINLPDGATVIDFAYAVHTDIGHACIGARVNEVMVSLDTKLKSGDMVHILTDKNRTKPNPDWLHIVKTHSAKEKIRARLKNFPIM